MYRQPVVGASIMRARFTILTPHGFGRDMRVSVRYLARAAGRV